MSEGKTTIVTGAATALGLARGGCGVLTEYSKSEQEARGLAAPTRRRASHEAHRHARFARRAARRHQLLGLRFERRSLWCSWVARVTGQLLAACDELESELERKPLPCSRWDVRQSGISIAVVWHGNERAIRFYASQGFARMPVGARSIELGGREVGEIAYALRAARSKRPPTPPTL